MTNFIHHIIIATEKVARKIRSHHWASRFPRLAEVVEGALYIISLLLVSTVLLLLLILAGVAIWAMIALLFLVAP